MKRSTLYSLTLAAIGMGGLGTSVTATADVVASFSAGSMYLWRGLSLSGAGPVISGDIYYNAPFGLYTSIWTSSEGNSGSHETDLNIGFSKKFGDFGIDVGVYEYLYPESQSCISSVVGSEVVETCEDVDLMDSDSHEWYIGGSFGPVSVKLFQNTQLPDARYVTIDGGFGVFGAHVGFTKTGDSDTEYNDFNVSVTPAENLMFIMSIARGDGAPEEDPLFVVSYKWPFPMK